MVLNKSLQVMLLLALGLFVEQLLAYQQSDYNLTSERVEILEYDKKWMVLKSKNFKYNRTQAAVNITWRVYRDMLSPEGVVQGYKFASNEYRLFPISFGYDACKALQKDDFGLLTTLTYCGNFTGCPIMKGYYEACNWMPDESKFPPYIPSGRYMFELKLFQSSEQAAVWVWYLKIEKKFHYI